MPYPLWIQPLESRLPVPLANVTHLEVEVNHSLWRYLDLAQKWFDASPEPLLEIQSFRAEVRLLEHMGDAPVLTGKFADRPTGLEPSSEEVAYAHLHVTRQTCWFEVGLKHDEVLDAHPVVFNALPKPDNEKVPANNQEHTTQVTLALEMTILHEGLFTEDALEELLHNLDFALNQQRDSASLAPECVDGVTQAFAFYELDVRGKESS